MPRALSPAFWLFAAGFFCSSWDLLLSRKVGGFTLKAYQPLFALCALVLLAQRWRAGQLHRHLAPLSRPFALAFAALAFYYLGFAPWSWFPLKSFLYACWLLFDLLAVWLSVQLLAEEVPERAFINVVTATLLFLSAVVLVDYAAYPLGYHGGLIGNNQDSVLHIGVSRPHAFSSEPSYAASFLCLGFFTAVPFLLQRARRKWIAGLAALAALFAIVATTSRTGWVSLVLGIMLLACLPLLSGRRLRWKLLLGLLGAIPLAIAIFTITTPQAQQENIRRSLIGSVLEGRDSSGNSRLKAMALAFDYARDTHWLGTGLGASWRYFREHGGYEFNFQGAVTARENGNEIIMSTWGQLLGEGGLLAPLLFLLAASALIRELWRAQGSAITHGSLVGAILAFGFIAFWLGNVCRGDLWVWYALWSGFASQRKAQSPL